MSRLKGSQSLNKRGRSRAYGEGEEDAGLPVGRGPHPLFDAEDSNALQISHWGVLLGGILAIMVVEVSTAVGLQTGAYVLAVGLSVIVLNEFRISRSRTL